MKLKSSTILTTLLFCVTSSSVGAAPALSSTSTPAVAWSAGVLRINDADHSGSGNLLPGSRLDTLKSAGQLYLADGTRLNLAASTRLKLQSGSLQLEGGAARIDSTSTQGRSLQIQAGDLQISAASGTVQRLSSSQVIVSAGVSSSSVRKGGTLIAMVRPGQTLTFSSADANSNSMKASMTGRVTSTNGQFYLTDELTNVTTELHGVKPSSYQGYRVRARGELIPDPSSDRSRLMVKEYAMLHEQDPPAGQSPKAAPAETPGAAPAASQSGQIPAVVGQAATHALSKTAILGIVVASGAGLGATVGFISSGSDTTISK